MELNSKTVKKILFIVFCSVLILVSLQNLGSIFGFISKIISLFSPIIAALCIAFVLNVLLTPLETKVFRFMDNSKKKFIVKLKRPLCLVLTYIIGLGIISLLILVIIPDIIDTIVYLADKLPSFVLTVRDWIESTLTKFNLNQEYIPDLKINWSAVANTIKKWVSGSSARIFGDAVNITTSVFSGIFDAIFSIVISVYVLAQKEKIGRFTKRTFEAFLPDKAIKPIYHISSKAADCFTRFIGGQFTEAVILGILCFIGMSIFGFPNALIISVLISVTSFVPIIGATIGVSIGFLLIVISNPIKAVLFVLFFLILQQIEGNLIYPRVMGKAVGLPGVIIISAVLIGGNIGGVLGTLLAVPTSAVLYSLVKEAIDLANQRKASVSTESAPEE